MDLSRPKEYAAYLRIPELGNLELLHAAYCKQRFSPHFHNGHVIGAIEKGALGFDYRGEKLVASQGQINLADPGEVHNGFSAGEQGWQYRMFYLGQDQLAAILGEDAEKKVSMPFFGKGVIHDSKLAKEILSLHRDFTDPAVSSLEKETRFYNLVNWIVRSHARESLSLPDTGKEEKKVAQVRAYIEDHFADSIVLDDLSRVSGLSKFYLVRVFSSHTGLTPHAYLSHVRAARAKQMMHKKKDLAGIALAAGFFDQSHLNRIFKKIYGITPGKYCRGRMDL